MNTAAPANFELDPASLGTAVICLADENDYPACPYPIYCSEDIWLTCVAWDHKRDLAKIQRERRDELLSSFVAGVNKALATEKGDVPKIRFKHFFRDSHRARKNSRAKLEAHTSFYPGVNKPFVIICSEGWFSGQRH